MAELDTGNELVLVDKIRKKKSKKRKVDVADERLTPGVVYVGRVPHGFYEKEMEGFFSQFGEVKRLRVSRNKKTGRCKGFAFVEFACDEVAKIVAETMNNYLMFNKLLKCQYIDSTQVHPGMLGGRRRVRELRAAIRLRRAQRKHNRARSTEEHKRRIKHLLLRERKSRKKLQSLGIDYDYPGYTKLVENSGQYKPPTHTLFVNNSDSE